jgi:sulfate adenylyltransferase subunit 1 (EFTu-like GTPase family)
VPPAYGAAGLKLFDVPLLSDPSAKNRATGSFILIDEATDVTVCAGMING